MTSLLLQDVIKFRWPNFVADTAAALPHTICIIDSSVDPICRICGAAPHTLEHWLQECPITAAQRLRFLGSTNPPLSVLCTCGKLSRDTGVAHSSSINEVFRRS